MGRWFRRRLGRGITPGGSGFFNRPGGRFPGGGGGGGGHLLLMPLHLLMAGVQLVMGMKAARPKHQKQGSRAGRHQHPKKGRHKGLGRGHRAHHARKHGHIHRPRLTRHPRPGHRGQRERNPLNSRLRKLVAPYFTGPFIKAKLRRN